MKVLSATLDVITQSVAEGKKITSQGFGTFEPRERKARTGRNPKTGENIEIKAKKVPVFTPAKGFKDAVEQAA